VKLRIDDITAQAREFSFFEPEQEINRALAQGPVREYFVKSPVRVCFECYRAGTELFATGSIDAVTRAVCSRCAEEFDSLSHRAFRYVLAPEVLGDEQEFGLRAEDLEFSEYQGEEIDLSPLIREQVLLALTPRPLCRDDCRGLCPRCGINQNEQSCNCTAVTPDPRLAVLRTLKVGRR
jgi:uncharacterized protein